MKMFKHVLFAFALLIGLSVNVAAKSYDLEKASYAFYGIDNDIGVTKVEKAEAVNSSFYQYADEHRQSAWVNFGTITIDKFSQTNAENLSNLLNPDTDVGWRSSGISNCNLLNTFVKEKIYLRNCTIKQCLSTSLGRQANYLA